MSVSVTLAVTEAGILTALLGGLEPAAELRQRLLAAEATCEQQGSPQFQMTFSPLEQGFLMGALAPSSCLFCGDLRAKIQGAMVSKLRQLGVSGG